MHIYEAKDKDEGFYFLICNEYDTHLDIQNSKRSDFNIAIPRDVEPRIIKVLDFDLQNVNNHKELRVLSLTDDDFVYDTVTYNL